MTDQFIDLCLAVQAVRRRVEREVAGLGGALGVAAAPYPHQLANVQRVLSDTGIRHLIADEVGLGKTVQALMILNALRLRHAGHRTLIVVPEGLAPQWLLEARSRGHVVPLAEAPGDAEGGYVRLAYAEQLKSMGEIDPGFYDLLIVDEIQRLQSTMRQRIETVAGDFRQLLLLSATPKLEETEALRQLLAILEPERIALAARTSETPEAELVAREHLVLKLLEQNQADAWRAAGFDVPPERERGSTLASTYCNIRRVTNARRRDYPDLLPQRVLNRVAVEPTADEVARQREIWRYINFARESDEPTDLAKLGQVALRSPRALSERINVLRGRDKRDDSGFLQAATQHLSPANGDSRLEALIDVLAEIWRINPREGVLVVAEDTPTVDYLETQIPRFLPEIGPSSSRRPLSVAVKRNRDTSATGNFVDLFEEYEESLGGFVDGDDQLLIAAEAAQVGLNLQHARKIIFFSMPWSPSAVEQWIGRLDRLGSAALRDNAGDRTIDIYAIYQRGQVDERVVDVLDDFAIFRRSIRLDSDEIKRVGEHIEAAALTPRTGDWAGLSAEARQCSGDDDGPLATPLSSLLPWSADQARQFAAYFDERGNLGPVIETSRAKRAIVRTESALRGWMRLMQRSDALRLWKKQEGDGSEQAFRLLHYFKPRYGGAVEPRFLLPGIDPHEGQRYAYLDDRRMLETPPTDVVDVDDNPYTPLEFLDHGNALHDALVAAWEKIGKELPSRFQVNLPAGHHLAEGAGSGHYLLFIAHWIPGDLHFQDLDRDPILKGVSGVRTDTERNIFWSALQRMEEDLRADRRWLNSQFAARFDVIAARFEQGAWHLTDQTTADALVTPWCLDARGKDLKLASNASGALPSEVRSARDAGSMILLQEYMARHARSLAERPDIKTKIASRRYQVAAEASESVAWRQALLDDAAVQGLETSEHGFMRSRFRVLQHARDMAVLARDVRLARLDALFDNLQRFEYTEYKLATISVL
jgi:ATP-dependent helicase HepA